MLNFFLSLKYHEKINDFPNEAKFPCMYVCIYVNMRMYMCVYACTHFIIPAVSVLLI